jgi:hypothetical protein
MDVDISSEAAASDVAATGSDVVKQPQPPPAPLPNSLLQLTAAELIARGIAPVKREYMLPFLMRRVPAAAEAGHRDSGPTGVATAAAAAAAAATSGGAPPDAAAVMAANGTGSATVSDQKKSRRQHKRVRWRQIYIHWPADVDA